MKIHYHISTDDTIGVTSCDEQQQQKQKNTKLCLPLGEWTFDTISILKIELKQQHTEQTVI